MQELNALKPLQIYTKCWSWIENNTISLICLQHRLTLGGLLYGHIKRTFCMGVCLSNCWQYNLVSSVCVQYRLGYGQGTIPTATLYGRPVCRQRQVEYWSLPLSHEFYMLLKSKRKSNTYTKSMGLDFNLWNEYWTLLVLAKACMLVEAWYSSINMKIRYLFGGLLYA